MIANAELEVRRDDAAAVPPQVQNADMLALLFKAASDPTCNTANMKDLLAMVERMETVKRETAFNEALVRVQSQIPQISQRGLMDRGAGKGVIPYALLEDIDRQIRPIYSEEGFAIAWDCQPQSDGRLLVSGQLKHRMGHSQPFSIVMPLDPSGGKTGPQSVTSAISYAKRTALKMIFNIIERGTDKNGADIQSITQEQADDIRDKLTELGGNISVFCEKVMNVSRIEDILAKDIDEAWKQINLKARKVQR